MIDAGTGNIHLPNGYVITPALTLEAFQQSWFAQDAADHHLDLQEQCWFEVDAGTLELRSALASILFRKQKVFAVDLSLLETCYLGDGIAGYFATERSTKLFHDNLLQHGLGDANCFTKTNCSEPGLDKAPNYFLSWGNIVSSFDWGAGNAYISIKYKSDKAL